MTAAMNVLSLSISWPFSQTTSLIDQFFQSMLSHPTSDLHLRMSELEAIQLVIQFQLLKSIHIIARAKFTYSMPCFLTSTVTSICY